MKSTHTIAAAILLAVATAASPARTLRVGPGQQFAQPSQAVAAAKSGDVIEIDAAGTYDGDVCHIKNNDLTLRGINGRAKLDSKGRVANARRQKGSRTFFLASEESRITIQVRTACREAIVIFPHSAPVAAKKVPLRR